jgi:hypothetical protein
VSWWREDAGVEAEWVEAAWENAEVEAALDVGTEVAWVEATRVEAPGLKAVEAGYLRNGNIERNLSTTS